MEGLLSDLVLDPVQERARFEARLPFLARQEAMRVVFAPGVFLQPETAESVEDQVRETLWAEGKSPETCDPAELAEVRASFAVLAPRREAEGVSFAATLMIGVGDAEREARLAQLETFPGGLLLELADGRRIPPEVDRGLAPEGGRLPSVLALRWRIPAGAAPAAWVSTHPAISGRWPAPSLAAWTVY